jgi:hypothetical protein
MLGRTSALTIPDQFFFDEAFRVLMTAMFFNPNGVEMIKPSIAPMQSGLRWVNVPKNLTL